jgi:hypothetical protein
MRIVAAAVQSEISLPDVEERALSAEAVPLAEFDPPIARAVVTVLRRAGLPAAVGDTNAEEATVVVPADRREEAFAVLSRSMDDVQAEVAGSRTVTVRRRDAERRDGGRMDAGRADADVDDDEYGPPLLFERLRQFGFLAVLLVPLLVVTLAQVRLPGIYMAVAVIAGVVALTAWRNGRMDRSEE